MILFLIFILFLFVENIFLPAIVGPGLFLITPIFMISIIIHTQSFKKSLFQVTTFALIGELFAGMNIGATIFPVLITFFLYFLIDRFIELRSGMDDMASLPAIFGRSLVLLFLSYLYSWFFIFIQSSFNVIQSWNEWRILLGMNAVFPIFAWAFVFCFIFAYVLKTK